VKVEIGKMSLKRGQLKRKKVVSLKDRTTLLEGEQLIETDRPAPFVSRITLNRPNDDNRLNNQMKAQLFEQLQINDQDPDVRVTIIRGAGKHFCSGNQAISGANNTPLPFFTDESDGQLQRNALAGWFMMQDLGKPTIAQVHGNCLGSGNELASACDMVYVANDAQIGYPEVRNYGLPDTQMYPWLTGMRNALSIMLLAETMDGTTSVERGWATGAYPESELDSLVLEKAKRVAKIPADLLAYNKRSVYRAFEAQGMRTNLRTGTDLEALMFHSVSAPIIKRAEQQAAAPPRRRRAGTKAGNTASPRSAGQTAQTQTDAAKGKSARAAVQRKPAAVSTKKSVAATKPSPARAVAPARPVSKRPAVIPNKVASQSATERPKLDSNAMAAVGQPATAGVIPSPAEVAARMNSGKLSNEGGSGKAKEQKIEIHINQPLTLHIHNEEDEPKSKL